MPQIAPLGLDWSTGDTRPWFTTNGVPVANEGAADKLSDPTNLPSRMDVISAYGRKWSDEVAAQAWQSRWPMSETAGTIAADVIGSHDGTINGGVTLNQAATPVAANLKSFLFDGSSGWINLGANGWDLTSGDWSLFCAIKTASLVSSRGIIGGPPGAVTVSIASTGRLQVGIAAGSAFSGTIALPDDYGYAMVNGNWFFVGLDYHAASNTFQVHSYYTNEITAAGRFHYATARTAGWTGSVKPTAGVKSNQIGRIDTGGYFHGNMQELLVKKAPHSRYDYTTLHQDSSKRTVSLSTVITPPPFTVKKAMQHVVSNIAQPGQSQAGSTRAEWKKKWWYGDYHNQVGFYTFMVYLDPATNWANIFQANPDVRGLGLTQMLGRALQSGSPIPQIMADGLGETGLSMNLFAFGGLTKPGISIEHFLTLATSPANNWTVLAPPSTNTNPHRWPQIIGPHCQTGVSRPLTIGEWHFCILEILHKTDSPTGYYRFHHRRENDPNWVITLSTPAVYKTVTYDPASGVPAVPVTRGEGFEVISNGLYAYQVDHSCSYFMGGYACYTTLAEAKTSFDTSGPPPPPPPPGGVLPPVPAGHLRRGNEQALTITPGPGVLDSKRVLLRSFGPNQQVSIDAAYHYAQGPLSGGPGAARLVVYDDDPTDGLPAALLGQSAGTGIAQGATAGWFDISPSSPIVVDTGASGLIYIGVQWDGPGEVSFGYEVVAGQGWRNAPDDYTDGPTDPFGTPVVIGREIGLVVDYSIVGADVTAPVFVSAFGEGQTVVLTYNEALDEASVPASSAYTVTIAGTPTAVDTVAVVGATVELGFSTPIVFGNSITASYVVPTAPQASVRDLVGNTAAALTGQAVTNASIDPGKRRIFPDSRIVGGTRRVSPSDRRIGEGGGL